MTTIRDDLVRVGRRLLETVEDRTGREVIATEQLQLLESDRSELRVAQKTLEFIGFSLWNYRPEAGVAGGFELRPEIRRFTAAQSWTAWVEDPMAGQQVDLYCSFVFGRGVPRPQAHDPEVQKILDDAWDDPANQRILTSYQALIEKGVDLCCQSNLFFKIFDTGEDGMVRLSLERFEDVVDAVRHSDLAAAGRGDRFRILYYRSCERETTYKFDTGVRQPTPGYDTAKPIYYEAYGAFDPDDPVQARQDEGLRKPPEDRVRPGLILHLAVNKGTEMAFGVPRMRRLLNWFGTYNDMLVSFRDRMKAMASVYMQATAQGAGTRDLERLARMATTRPSSFGGAQDLEGDDGRPRAPRGPGTLWGNEGMRYEPFKIDSGAGDVDAAAPIIRGQLSGPWPDHYMSGIADGALAGSQSMELPTLTWIYREQEVWRLPFTTLADRSIQRKIDVGDLSEYRQPSQSELDRIQAAEEAGEPVPFELDESGKVKRDVGYDFSFPDPLKRTMLDVVSAAVETATAVDPMGQNPEMSRWLLGFILAEAFDVADPMRIVDQVLPRTPRPAPTEEGDVDEQGNPIGPDGQPLPKEGAVGPDGQRHTADNPGGAPISSPQLENRPRVQETPEVQAAAVALLESVLVASANGNGAGR